MTTAFPVPSPVDRDERRPIGPVQRAITHIAENLPHWSMKLTAGLYTGASALWEDEHEPTPLERVRHTRRQAELTRKWAVEVRKQAQLSRQQARLTVAKITGPRDNAEEETTRG